MEKYHPIARVKFQEGKYHFRLKTPDINEDVTVLYSGYPDFSSEKVCFQGKANQFSVFLPEKRRHFFRINHEGKSLATCACYTLEETSITNFRDLGGYRNQDGQSVKWGYLYRSGSLDKLTQDQQEYLQAMGLKIVFDLRSKSEIDSEPDRLLPDWTYINQPGLPDLDNDMASQGLKGNNLDPEVMISKLVQHPEAKSLLNDYLLGAYRSMAYNGEAFARLFQVLLDNPHQPLVFHCSAGKDRTGIAAAFILLALGVDEETVIRDYLYSNKCRQEENNQIMEKIAPYVADEELLRLIRRMLEVDRQYIDTTFDIIKETYGSIDNYLTQGLGLHPKDRETLRRLYMD